MANDSAEQIYELLKRYLFPILKFANIYVDEKGILRPIGRDPTLSYQEEGRDLIIIDSQVKYQEIKAKKDEFQIFNPFSIPKQTVFLANMVMMTANQLDDSNTENKNMIYDEDLDEWIPKDENMTEEQITNDSGSIKLFEIRDPNYLVNTKITFSHTDKSGNPIDEIASFSHQNVILAIVGAIINLIKKFQRTITVDFTSTEAAIINIDKSLNKIAQNREKERKEKPQKLHISNLDDEEELIEEMMECDKDGYFIDPYISADTMFLPTDKKCEYDPHNPNSKLCKNMFLPNYKIVSDNEEVVKTIADAQDIIEYQDMDFLL